MIDKEFVSNHFFRAKNNFEKGDYQNCIINCLYGFEIILNEKIKEYKNSLTSHEELNEYFDILKKNISSKKIENPTIKDSTLGEKFHILTYTKIKDKIKLKLSEIEDMLTNKRNRYVHPDFNYREFFIYNSKDEDFNSQNVTSNSAEIILYLYKWFLKGNDLFKKQKVKKYCINCNQELKPDGNSWICEQCKERYIKCPADRCGKINIGRANYCFYCSEKITNPDINPNVLEVEDINPILRTIRLIRIEGGYLKDPNNEQKYVSQFYISEFPITNAVMNIFFEDIKVYEKDLCFDENTRTEILEKPDYPKVGTQYHLYLAFCEWLSYRLRKMNYIFRLPTVDEWKLAAGNNKDSLYKYPVKIDKDKITSDNVNFNNKKKSPNTFNEYLDNKSSFGIKDMAGNVWEFCLGKYLAGGSWKSSKQQLKIDSIVLFNEFIHESDECGFRIVAKNYNNYF